MTKIEKSAQEWRELLAAKGAEPVAFAVTRQAGFARKRHMTTGLLP